MTDAATENFVHRIGSKSTTANKLEKLKETHTALMAEVEPALDWLRKSVDRTIADRRANGHESTLTPERDSGCADNFLGDAHASKGVGIHDLLEAIDRIQLNAQFLFDSKTAGTAHTGATQWECFGHNMRGSFEQALEICNALLDRRHDNTLALMHNKLHPNRRPLKCFEPVMESDRKKIGMVWLKFTEHYHQLKADMDQLAPQQKAASR